MFSVKFLKKSSFIKKIYRKVESKLFPLLVKCSPLVASKYLYKRALGESLNLRNPQNFNEKLQWLKLFWQHPLVSQGADKYGVRAYVKQSGCEEILNELYGVYKNVSEINWDLLPLKFVLKTTNGCGTNIICTDKTELNKQEAFHKLKQWMTVDYGLPYAEIHYSKIEPKIICERYIESEAGTLPNDYKIYCFNGKAKLVLACTDRETNIKLDFFDLEWNRADIASESFNKGSIPNKPKCLDDMIYYAEKLAKPFPFVRVDFYDYYDKPLFGELTFTPAGCIAKYYNDHGLKLLGEWIKLPKKYTG